VQQILITLQRVDDLITQHTTDARAIKQLREREQILTDLYRIFSKDVMIKVLEDSLPFFAEYINNVLAKMVSFHITFAPRKTTSDKLELDITIHDHHGERSIKSLSGGQKAILRLAWTLGVAKMSGSEQLLLDETINNIDHQTIQDVTHMLEDYLTTNDIPLYIVTHSQQLQQMSLWDEVIELIP
jgi:DNA repair exonuclease SbcCD ATPase subunit